MQKIHELTTILADQIAAGEVIERPASVVKELMENAIDAHATQIDILLEEAGIKKIEIIDNGFGISQDEVELAFRRHATSKIVNRTDLFKIKTLGFRGEALPSIAAIADVTMMTAVKDKPGMLINIKGGQIIIKKSAPSRVGTAIVVKNLFFNTPARLKYLKTPNTELSKIVDIVNRLALSYPNIAFNLKHEDHQLLKTAGNGNVQQVIANIYGLKNARKMLTIETENIDFKVSGFISLPELTRASREYISILINGRYIKNYQLVKALLTGYGSRLMVGRYPLAVISINMDPLLVDVNVHPTKQEVRLSQESQLMELLTSVVQERLATLNLMPDGYQNLKQATSPKNDITFIERLNQVSQHHQITVSDENDLKQSEKKDEQWQATNSILTSDTKPVQPIIIKTIADLERTEVKAFKKRYQVPLNQQMATNKASVKSIVTDLKTKQLTLNEDIDSIGMLNNNELAQVEKFPNLRFIGQMFGTFLFAEGPAGLYLIDQHAAQERINYEYYREEIIHQGNAQQKLLVPLVLDYPLVDALKIKQKLTELAQVGLIIEDFGDNSFVVHQHPMWFVAGQEEATIREMIDWLLRDGNIDLTKFREKAAIMMSCKRAIKANTHLDDAQAIALIEKLKSTKNPFNCPHGRPVVVTLSLKDMEKMFKRIQDSHSSWLDYDSHPY
ncbi:DNA mismatch repair endonuclease MutL [Periweissella beninensis]|uniref:DNA mismatch repair endonuclease MutL n=1 Tax=Periweissella beninensis TaxID=504936 RepID=UPI0021A4CA34|nr:DNA mismatch repair endonuclease MutL [Periweissella beninensis]MCT4396408.1 DNA mismatch repair endonuclease MutL [Periweissella beninensis]